MSFHPAHLKKSADALPFNFRQISTYLPGTDAEVLRHFIDRHSATG